MAVKSLIVLAIVIVIIYVLYINGLLTFSSKKALMFLGKYNLNTKEYSATFKSCTGYIKRVIVFKESKSILFNLETVLEKGEISVTITDFKGKTIAVLTPETPQCNADITQGRYLLTIKLYKAYGKYALSCK